MGHRWVYGMVLGQIIFDPALTYSGDQVAPEYAHVTANQPFSEWDSIFPDNVMSVAAIDRLVHHTSIIKIASGSYRRRQQMNEKKKRKTGKDN